MSLVNAKCTNCGANLKVDSAKDAAICEFCGSAYIVEKAINNYNITNNNNINANVVNIYGGNSADFIIRAGTLEKYNGASTDVVIPNTVTCIGQNAFRGCKGLKSIKIPNSVTVIECSAFENCTSLTDIQIPNSVTTIEHDAFCHCTNLTRIEIPNSVTKMGYSSSGGGVFNDCTGLINVKIQYGVTEICPKSFIGCTSLTNVEIPNSVTRICHDAFNGCKGLKSIKLPTSVAYIGNGAFSYCTNLTSIEIPSSVTTIGYSAFEGCKKLTNVNIPQECQVGNGTFKDTLFEKNKRKQQNLCQHCGGTFKGIFNKVCSKCGKPKDY